MSNNCNTGISIPTLLPTEPCEGNYLSTDCVASPNANSTLDLPIGATQTQINAAITTALLHKEEQVQSIITDVENIDVRPYQVYTALISQTGTSAPTSIVLENTLGGSVIWTRDSTGVYTGTLAGAFAVNKCFSSINTGDNFIGTNLKSYRGDSNTFKVASLDLGTLTVTDGLLNLASLEIRVYN